jgi:hypothetical protein
MEFFFFFTVLMQRYLERFGIMSVVRRSKNYICHIPSLLEEVMRLY